MAEWWETFFHGVVLDMWRLAVTEEQTKRDADRIEKLLGLSPGAKILDAPCGNGRIAIELAKRGYQVAGIDIADDYVAEANGRAKELELAAKFQIGDMRNMPWKSAFDGVFCTGNSFGYCDDAGNKQFIESVARALKPNGKFLLETPMVAETVLLSVKMNAWYSLGEIYCLADRNYDPLAGRLNVNYNFLVNGASDKRAASYRVYTCRQICELVAAAGLEVTRTWATPDGAPFTLGSPELLLLASKP